MSTKEELQKIANAMASRLLLEEWKPSRKDYDKVLQQIVILIRKTGN
jgi:hypothetical protein